MTTLYNLNSGNGVHAPGMIKYIVLELIDNPILQRRMINTGWPGMPDTAVNNLIDGKYTITDNQIVHVSS